MIRESVFKGVKSFELENAVIKAIVLPDVGGKVASLYRKDKAFELLFQNKEEIYTKSTLYAPFELFDASGFDDAFPTIDSCKVMVGGREVLYPDHGEIWSATFDYEVQGEKLVLKYHSKILDYSYEKSFELEEDRLKVSYNIKNTGEHHIPCLWAFHCLINCEEDMEIIFPEGTEQVLNVHGSKHLGEIGTVHNYPIAKTPLGEAFNLNKVLPLSSNNTEKYYALGKVEKGQCGAYYPSKDVHYNVYFNKEVLPYVGFWVTEGGFRGDYNCALEPCNGYYDSIDIAEKNNALYVLCPKEELNFNIEIEMR